MKDIINFTDDQPVPCEHGHVGACIQCHPGYSLSTVLRGLVLEPDTWTVRPSTRGEIDPVALETTSYLRPRVPDQVLALTLVLEQEGFTTRIDKPRDHLGEWWVDISRGSFVASVAYRPHLGFGIYTNEHNGYGENPDQVIVDPVEAAGLVLSSWRSSEAI